MILEVRAAPPFYKNGFLVACERTRAAALVDPGDEVDGLLAAARDYDADVHYILLTHAHVDHVSGVGAAKAAFDVPIHLHRDDLPLYEHATQQAEMLGLRVSAPPPVDVFYDLTPIPLGDYEVRVHHTPGHCPGGVCLQVGKKGEPGRNLLVGDTLFAGSIGRTDLPGGDHAALMRSIKEKLLPLGDDIGFICGHGPGGRFGEERRTNPFLV